MNTWSKAFAISGLNRDSCRVKRRVMVIPVNTKSRLADIIVSFL